MHGTIISVRLVHVIGLWGTSIFWIKVIIQNSFNIVRCSGVGFELGDVLGGSLFGECGGHCANEFDWGLIFSVKSVLMV